MSLAHLIKKGEQVGSPISNSSDRRVEIGLLALSWPILIENLIRISLNSADVFMLSWYSEKAVAAVGLINQFIFFLQLLYLMVASGSGILISQNIGAGREKDRIGGIGQFAVGLSVCECVECVDGFICQHDT